MLIDPHFLPPSQAIIPLASALRQGGEVVRELPNRAEPNTTLDTGSERSWLELVRDVVAMGNSGGGVLAVELRDAADSQETATNAKVLESLRERLRQYTGEPFEQLKERTADRSRPTSVAISVPALTAPVGFTAPGVWGEAGDDGQRHVVFRQGSFYFRHGEASEPGTTADMRAFLQAHSQRLRQKWLGRILRALAAPVESAENWDAVLATTTGQERSGQFPLRPVRIVADPAAPALQPQDVERLYPWRQKELVQELNRRLGQRRLNSYDIQAVRRHHRLDERADFVFNLPGAGRRYSDAAVEWLEQQARDPAFFLEARAADQAMLKLRRRKPR